MTRLSKLHTVSVILRQSIKCCCAARWKINFWKQCYAGLVWNTTPLSAQATLRANYDSYLKKMSTGYSPQTQTVKWMIQYNYAGNMIPAGTMIADIYNNIGNTVPMSFDPATENISCYIWRERESCTESNQPLASSEYSLTENADPGNRFEITFTNGLTGAYNIVYETKAEQAPGNIVNTDQMIAMPLRERLRAVRRRLRQRPLSHCASREQLKLWRTLTSPHRSMARR